MWILKYCKDLLCCCNSLFYSRKFHLFKKLASSVYKPFLSKQYDCSPPLTTDKMLVIFINNSYVEQVEAPAIYLSLYGFLWSFGFQYKLEVTIFLVKQNIHWWHKWLMIRQNFVFVIISILVSRITRVLCYENVFD